MLLWILCFWFLLEAILHPSCYLTSTVDKTHHGSVIAPFSLQLLQLFCYVGGILVTNLFSLLLIDIFWLFSKL